MVANVPLWVTCAVLSSVIGLAFALTALARLGWHPADPLKRSLCFWRSKKGAECGAIEQYPSSGGGIVERITTFSGGGDGGIGEKGAAAAETVEDDCATSPAATTTTTSGLSLSFLRARARVASGLTKDDADAVAAPEFRGGVLGQPWKRGCACEVSK